MMLYGVNHRNGQLEKCNDQISCNHTFHLLPHPDFPNYEDYVEAIKSIKQPAILKYPNFPQEFWFLPCDKVIANKDFIHRTELPFPIMGIQDKYYNPKTQQYVKLDSPKGSQDITSEGLREDLIYQVIQLFNFSRIVSYHSILFLQTDGTWAKGVISDEFKQPGESELSFAALELLDNRLATDSFDIIKTDEEIISEQILIINNKAPNLYHDYFKILFFDAITNNRDRYYNPGNFGLLRHKEKKTYSMLPPFDNGAAIEIPYDKQDIINRIHKIANIAKMYSINQPLLVASKKQLFHLLATYQNDLYEPKVFQQMLAYLMFAFEQSENLLWKDDEHADSCL